MRIKVLHIIAAILGIAFFVAYIYSWYIFLTHFVIEENIVDTILRPFGRDSHMEWNYDIAQSNIKFATVFYIGNIVLLSILILFSIILLKDKEIEI